jgi:hypothetical protein
MAMNPKQFERWARTRAKGRARFIWIDGVIGWGLTMAVILLPLFALTNGWGPVQRSLPFALVLFPVVGYGWGVRMWHLSERQYAETVGRNAED